MRPATETHPIKLRHFIFPFLAACSYLTMSCLAAPAMAQNSANQSEGNAVTVINEGLNSNVGGSMISLTKEVTDQALGKSAIKSFGDAWKANKSGESSSAIGGLLEKSANLKDASNILNKGGVLIDHAGYTSTAAGEIAEGNYAQGFITIADGLGKSVVSGLASATGASFGTLAGPAGTIAGGVAGGYAGSEAWDESVGKLTAAIKAGLGEQEDKRQFREMSGPKMLGRTPEKIHEAWLNYKKELDDKKRQAQLEAGKNNVPVVKPPLAPPPTTGKAEVKTSPDSSKANSLKATAPATLQSVVVTPANSSLEKGSTQQFTARGKYSDGTSRDVPVSATWSSSNSASVAVSSSGLATAVSSGDSIVTVTYDNISGSAALTVPTGAVPTIVDGTWHSNDCSDWTFNGGSGQYRHCGWVEAEGFTYTMQTDAITLSGSNSLPFVQCSPWKVTISGSNMTWQNPPCSTVTYKFTKVSPYVEGR